MDFITKYQYKALENAQLEREVRAERNKFLDTDPRLEPMRQMIFAYKDDIREFVLVRAGRIAEFGIECKKDGPTHLQKDGFFLLISVQLPEEMQLDSKDFQHLFRDVLPTEIENFQVADLQVSNYTENYDRQRMQTISYKMKQRYALE
jgi:hypothetical protein